MLLTVKEVAQRLRISLSHVYDLLSRGELPFYRIGGCKRVSEKDLEQFLENRREEPIVLPARQHKHF